MSVHYYILEWDENKSRKCLEDRGFDFSIADDFDFTTAITIEDDRFDYGETRYRAYNLIDNIGYSIVFTIRGPNIRIISIRKAHNKEMKRHGFQT